MATSASGVARTAGNTVGNVIAGGARLLAGNRSGGSAGGSLQDVAYNIDRILGVSQYNNAYSASQAADLRRWQEQQNQKAMEFSAAEAAKNRDWQKMMSDTAHQREVRDLLAAGLNPVLSVTGGNGAAVTSGATASGVTSSGAKGDTDMSANTAIVSLLGSLLAQQTQLANANTSALTNLAVADKYTAMSKYTSELQAQTQLSTASINAMASRYAADKHAEASKVAASISAAAQRYGYDLNAMTQRELAQFNAEVNKQLKQMGIDADFGMQDLKYGQEFALKQSFGTGELTGIAGLLGTGLYDMIFGQGSSVSAAKDMARSDYYRGYTRGGSFSGGVRR